TFIASVGGWRLALLVHGLATGVTALAVGLAVPAGAPTRRADDASGPSLRQLLDRRVLMLLGAGAMERACFVAIAVYLATYLVASYHISLTELAIALALIALGNLGGNVLGGQVADRIRARPLAFAASSLATAALALPLMRWQPGLLLSVVLGFGYSLTN